MPLRRRPPTTTGPTLRELAQTIATEFRSDVFAPRTTPQVVAWILSLVQQQIDAHVTWLQGRAQIRINATPVPRPDPHTEGAAFSQAYARMYAVQRELSRLGWEDALNLFALRDVNGALAQSAEGADRASREATRAWAQSDPYNEAQDRVIRRELREMRRGARLLQHILDFYATHPASTPIEQIPPFRDERPGEEVEEPPELVGGARDTGPARGPAFYNVPAGGQVRVAPGGAGHLRVSITDASGGTALDDAGDPPPLFRSATQGGGNAAPDLAADIETGSPISFGDLHAGRSGDGRDADAADPGRGDGEGAVAPQDESLRAAAPPVSPEERLARGIRAHRNAFWEAMESPGASSRTYTVPLRVRTPHGRPEGDED